MNRGTVRVLVSGVALAALVWWGGAPAARGEDSPGTAASASDSTQTPPAPGGKDHAKGTAAAKGKAKSAAKKAVGGRRDRKMGALPGTMPVKPAVAPEHITVQHILIGFRGSVGDKVIQRSKDEAKKLAYEILERARKGEDFDGLVRQYTDDSPPGIYSMSNNGVAAAPREFPRGNMVPAFGNIGFAMSPGNIGIADYDPQASPFGWHIIKRLK
jgi:parvulin-like peptidyl-prolyl cis-trans isomerase-like protein